jgi:hypothetical protein
VLGIQTLLRFLNGGRKLDSVLSRNVKLLNDLQARHGSKYKKVCDYYLAHRHLVAIEDVSPWVPELVAESAEIEEEGEAARTLPPSSGISPRGTARPRGHYYMTQRLLIIAGASPRRSIFTPGTREGALRFEFGR